MQIEYVAGDMFASEHVLVVHGCNAQGVMGSGVAKAVRDLYPGAFKAYRDKFDTRGLTMGEVVWYFDADRIVANGITQEFFGRDGRRYVDYDAVRAVFREVNEFCRRSQSGEFAICHFGKIETVALPLIGAGLGGGHWPTIAAIIEEEATSFAPVVYLIDGKMPV